MIKNIGGNVKHLKTQFVLFLAIIAALTLFVVQELRAQNKEEIPNKENQTMRSAVSDQTEKNFTLEFQRAKPQKVRQHIYESANYKTLAYLHWALGILDINDDNNIDYFMKITECNIYTRFKPDEFEWDKIKEATRKYIRENKSDFPVRFELVVPLKLGEYNSEKSFFDIQKNSQIKSVRLFELFPIESATSESLCGDENQVTGPYYKGLLLELSRPFSMTYVPVEKSLAEKYISFRNEIYQKSLENLIEKKYKQEDLEALRDAYLVLYIRIFTFKGKYTQQNTNLDLAQVLAVVEGYEIYGDIQRKTLFYSRNYITKRDEKMANINLQKEIEVLTNRLKDKGMLNSGT